MIPQLVLVVDDDASFAKALSAGLTGEGFRVEVAIDGRDALRRFDILEPDVVLLEMMLPELSGIEVCRQLRVHSRVPILMLTTRTSEIDTVVALEVGADDYIQKPYRLHELVARIRAVMRRIAEPAPERSLLQVGDLILRTNEHKVTVDGEQVELTFQEFRLLHLLLVNAGNVLTRQDLLTQIWGPHRRDDKSKTLDALVKRLRRKIEASPTQPTRIVTVRRVGYRYGR